MKTKGNGSLSNCPVCNSDDFRNEDYDQVLHGSIILEVVCNDCDSEWTEQYDCKNWILRYNGETKEKYGYGVGDIIPL